MLRKKLVSYFTSFVRRCDNQHLVTTFCAISNTSGHETDFVVRANLLKGGTICSLRTPVGIVKFDRKRDFAQSDFVITRTSLFTK